jgi:hypothetical protein
MTRVGYNMAPTLLDWQISRYVTFNAGQQEIVDKSLAALHEWHRQTQLPVYQRFLGSVSDRLSRAGDRPGPAELDAWRTEITGAWRAIPPQLALPIARIALTLSSEQIDDIADQMRKRDAEHLEESDRDASPQARREERLERWTSRAEWALGELSLSQQALLERRVRNAPDSTGWWQSRARQRAGFIALLRRIAQSGATEQAAGKQIEQWLNGFGEPTTEQERQYSETLRAYSYDTMAQMLALATDGQIRQLRRKIDGLSSDLQGLMVASVK